jgi:hypothetical protein
MKRQDGKVLRVTSKVAQEDADYIMVAISSAPSFRMVNSAGSPGSLFGIAERRKSRHLSTFCMILEVVLALTSVSILTHLFHFDSWNEKPIRGILMSPY